MYHLEWGEDYLGIFDLIENDNIRETSIKTEGIVLGIVTNNKDPEKLGRVKVKFPWLSDNDESRWARVITLMASKDYGTFFLPEVGDEVAISFDRGKIDYPYILGSLWNGENKPPVDNSDGKNHVRKIKTRGGHEIIFDDGDDGKIEINSKSGHKISLSDAKAKEKIEIKDKTGKNTILLDSTKNQIDISSEMKLKLKSKMIEIEAEGKLSIESKGDLSIKGTLVKIN